MCRKLTFLVSIILLLGLVDSAAAAILQCDAGEGALQAGWTQVVAGLNSNVAGTGIDVTLATGNPGAIAHRDVGGDGPLAYVETDFYFADDEQYSPGSDFILTLGNLTEGVSYGLLSYHNRWTETATVIPNVMVTGATNVTKPDSILQSHGIMDIPAEVLFTAGSGDVVVRYQGPDGGCAGCQAFFNGFQLEFTNPVIQFDSAASGALESVSPATLTVNLINPGGGATYTVAYAVSGGTATAGADYTLTPGTLTFDPGETSKTIGIIIVNDGLDEDDETLVVALSNPTGPGVILGAIAEHTYTIIDPRPGVQFDADGSVGMEDVTPVIVGVSLSDSLAEVVTVAYAVTGGTATGGGADYTLDDGTLTFNAGETNKVISITIVDDELEEENETIEVTLSNPSANVKLGSKNQHIYTIISDELGGPLYVNSLGMEFIRIEAGNFMMGSDSGEWDEKPVHHVTISQRFYIQAEEVTADEYRYFDANYLGSGYATGVSWHEAVAFADWLNLQEGLPYRLPTEAEWEYVCKNPGSVTNMQSSPREWIRDWHGEYPYDNQVDPVGPEQGFACVVRGGGLDNDNSYFRRPTNRAGIGAAFAGRQHPIGFRLVLGDLPDTAPRPYEAPFVRQGIKENTAQVVQAPDPNEPYYNQRPLLPIPPDNSSREEIDKVGLHPSFRGHNHSPGMEVCPNGDVLMIIYTSYSEYEEGVSLMATRLRFGSDWWDMPTPMFDFPGTNDHAPMLWNDNGTLHFFWGCPRLEGAGPYPFQWISSDDSGATWDEVKFPVFDGPIGPHSKQPINTAFRDYRDTMYVSSDGSGNNSLLWASDDNGATWYDTEGRTGGRHTTFVVVDDYDFLGMGGKNTDINGYMPQSISDHEGEDWDVSITPFCRMGGNQRPCIVRLASGRLFFCSDFQQTSDCYQPPGITEKGALAALSDDEGDTWLIKKIPTALRHESRSCDGATLGYSVARQAPNGIIHIITSMNHPCQHFEMNERWIQDANAGGDMPGDPGETGTVNQYQENYAGGATKVTWGAKTCDDGRYLLHGAETWYYEDGEKQYEAAYYNGRKVGAETHWAPDGGMRWRWDHNEGADTSVWAQHWPNGVKRVESRWRYSGKVAHGEAYHWDWDGAAEAAWNFADGQLVGSASLPDAQIKDADYTGDDFIDSRDLKVLVGHWLEDNFLPQLVGQIIGWWEFEEGSGPTAYDSVGSNDGTLNGDPSWVAGKVGSGAIELDGNGDYVSIGNAVTHNLPEGTFTTWVYPADLSKVCDIRNFAYIIGADDWAGGELGLRVNGDGSGWGSVQNDVPGGALSFAAGTFSVGSWHHVAMTWGGTYWKLYVNGVEKASELLSEGTSDAYNTALIGKGWDGCLWDGKIDDVRIYDYELDAGEVMRLYDGHAPEEKFVCSIHPVGDLNDDCEVNSKDFAVFALRWLESLP